MSGKFETSVAPRAILKSEWHPTRNLGIKFDDLPSKTNRKVWWLCSKNVNHEWQARFRNRMMDGDGCPFCAGRKVLKEDSFGAKFPQMLAEWHPTKNGTLNPFSFSPNSNKRVWWQCQTPYKHIWQTTVTTRVRNNSGCKQCNNIPRPLSVSCPEIAKQWHPTKNGEKTANDVSAGSKMKAWWRCDVDPTHEWKPPFTDARERSLLVRSVRERPGQSSGHALMPHFQNLRQSGIQPEMD